MKKFFIACLCALMVLPLGTFTTNVKAAETSGEHTWFFQQLDATSKLFYNAIDQMYKDGSLKNGNSSIDMLQMGLTSGQIEQYMKGEPALARAFHNAKDAFAYDHADVFYVNYEKLSFRVGKTNSGYVANVGSGSYANYYANGFSSRSQVDTAVGEVEAVKQEILNSVDGNANTEDKIEAVHDAIINKVTYTYADEAGEDSSFVDGIYGALVKGKAQCGGYAQALKYILDDLEIPTVLVFGVRDLGDDSVKEMHMWNYVQVDGSWFGMDVTWDDPIGGSLRYDYFLKGSAVFDKDHSEQGQISAGGQNFFYPIPYNASLAEKNAGEVAVSGLSVTGKISGDSTFFRISYNGMGREALNASGLGLTVAFRMMNGEGAWGSWMSTNKINLDSDIDNGTAFLMPVTNASKVQFAVTSAPDSLLNEVGVYKESPVQEQYLVALGAEENVSSYDPSNVKPFAVSSNPSMFSTLRNIDQDIVVTYDEKLVENGQPISVSLTNSSTSINASLEYVSYAYEEVALTGGGTKTMTNVTYRFHPDKTYQGYGNAYTFHIHNLVGEASNNEPNGVTFKTSFDQSIPCPLRHYTTPPSAFIMSDPILIDDPKEDRFETNSISTNSLNIQLIATKPNAKEQAELDQTVADQTGGKLLVSNSYDIDLSCKQLIAAVKPGYHVTIGLPYPDGFDYNQNKDVVFKAYHFKKVDGKLVAEELVCQITELGLVVIADSFSPFSVVAFEKGSVPEASTIKSVNATIQNGQGSIVTSSDGKEHSLVGLTAVKENETKDYEIKAEDGYVIERLLMDGKEVSDAAGKSNYTASINYATMRQDTTMVVDFVAKQVVEVEEKAGIEPVLPILEVVKVDNDQKDDIEDNETDDKKDNETDDKKDNETDDKKDNETDDKKDEGKDQPSKDDPVTEVTYEETTLQQGEVSVIGKLMKDTQLLVSSAISDEATTAFTNFAGENTIFKKFDISLSKENAFEGELTLQFKVDSSYEGKTIQILHYVNGKVESQDAKVVNGIATAKVTSLSPFALMEKKVNPVDVIVDAGFDSHQPYIWVFLILNLSGMLFVFKKNKVTKEIGS